jgi:hypothetical protein
MFKKALIGVSLALVLALSITGMVLAQDPPETGDEICPFGGECGGFGGGYGMRGFGYRGTMPGLLAEALGLTPQEVSDALAEGQTVAEIADAQGVSLKAVVAALIAPRAELLTQAVSEGRITQEQADWMLEEMTEHMTEQLENGAWGAYGGGCGMGGGMYGYRGGGYGMQGGVQGYRGGRGMRGGMWGNGTTTLRSRTNSL